MIVHVNQWSGPLDAASGANVIEQQHRRRPREAVADEAAREPVDGGVGPHQPPQKRPRPIHERHRFHWVIGRRYRSAGVLSAWLS